MKNQVNFVCVLFALLILGFSTQAAFAQDATKVDSTHYKVEFENDYVRVVRISYGPGEKSVMHEHPNAVAVDLTDGRVKMTYPDGKTEEVTAMAGQVVWTPAVKHLPQNTDDKPMEAILVEMKVKPAVKSFTETALAQDATKLDPVHYKVEFENGQVRVLRITYGPGEKSVMHEHHNAVAAVAINLTGAHFKMTYPDGKTEVRTPKAGQVAWTSSVKHLPENIGDKPVETILVEMKVRPETTKKD